MNTTFIHPSYWREEKRDIKMNPINNNCLHRVMRRTAKRSRRTYFRNNNENCNKQSVWRTMLSFGEAPGRLQPGLCGEWGGGLRVDLGPFRGIRKMRSCPLPAILNSVLSADAFLSFSRPDMGLIPTQPGDTPLTEEGWCVCVCVGRRGQLCHSKKG